METMTELYKNNAGGFLDMKNAMNIVKWRWKMASTGGKNLQDLRNQDQLIWHHSVRKKAALARNEILRKNERDTWLRKLAKRRAERTELASLPALLRRQAD
jgi:hypothetical protein